MMRRSVLSAFHWFVRENSTNFGPSQSVCPSCYVFHHDRDCWMAMYPTEWIRFYHLLWICSNWIDVRLSYVQNGRGHTNCKSVGPTLLEEDPTTIVVVRHTSPLEDGGDDLAWCASAGTGRSVAAYRRALSTTAPLHHRTSVHQPLTPLHPPPSQPQRQWNPPHHSRGTNRSTPKLLLIFHHGALNGVLIVQWDVSSCHRCCNQVFE